MGESARTSGASSYEFLVTGSYQFFIQCVGAESITVAVGGSQGIYQCSAQNHVNVIAEPGKVTLSVTSPASAWYRISVFEGLGSGVTVSPK